MHPNVADLTRDAFGNTPCRDVTIEEFLRETAHIGDEVTLRWFQIAWQDNAGKTQPGETLRITFGELRRFASRGADGRE